MATCSADRSAAQIPEIACNFRRACVYFTNEFSDPGRVRCRRRPRCHELAAAADAPRPAPQSPFAIVVGSPRPGTSRCWDRHRTERANAARGRRAHRLFTLVDGGHARQWLAEITVVRSPRMKAAPSSARMSSSRPLEMSITSQRARGICVAYVVRSATPMRLPVVGSVPESAPFSRATGFPELRLRSPGEAVLRLRAVGQEPPPRHRDGTLLEKTSVGKHWAEEAKFTANDELICVKQRLPRWSFSRSHNTHPDPEIVKPRLTCHQSEPPCGR